MVKITVTFGNFFPIEFSSEDIENNRRILLPISKEEFEKLLAESKDINLEFSL